MIYVINGLYHSDYGQLDFVYRGKSGGFLEDNEVYGFLVNNEKLHICVMDKRTFEKEFRYVKQYEPVTLWQKIKRLLGRK